MSRLFQVTKINNEKIAVNPRYVMTVSNSDNPTAKTVIQFPPSAGTANTLYVHETYDEVMELINAVSPSAAG